MKYYVFIIELFYSYFYLDLNSLRVMFILFGSFYLLLFSQVLSNVVVFINFLLGFADILLLFWLDFMILSFLFLLFENTGLITNAISISFSLNYSLTAIFPFCRDTSILTFRPSNTQLWLKSYYFVVIWLIIF